MSEASQPVTIPTGLRPLAQGCEGRATLGQRFWNRTTPTGLRRVYCVSGYNPVGVVRAGRGISQGSSCLATLGFGPESLWDSAVTAKTIEARRDAETAKLKTFLAELGYE
jgi:hypothetical protein